MEQGGVRRLASLVLGAAALVLVASTAHAAASDPFRSSEWNLDRIGAPAAWRVATGSGVTVAVVDSGVDLHHEDLAGQLLPGHDFVDNDDDPQDAYGHGTHVAGIIAALADNGKGIAGVAPGVKLLPVRVLDDRGAGTLDNVVAGIHWAVDHGAKVVNLSLGEDTQPLFGPAFGDALRWAWSRGAIPVVAAGNQFLTGSGFSNEPAMVVTATTRDDTKPTYSSGVGAAAWGIAAPGGELPNLGTEGAILSTYWTGARPNEYAYLAGTSQAAPHVSAALAILLSTGRFTPAQAVQRLLDTAKDIGSPGHDATFGAGRLDLAAATRDLPATGTTVAPRPPAAPPTVQSQAAAPTVTIPPPAASVPGPPATSSPDVTTPPAAGRTAPLVAIGAPRDRHESRTLPALVAAALAAGVVALQLRHGLLVALRRPRRPEVL